MPEVSVIIPTYNCAQYIPETIDSVLAQTFKNIEIIIVDDGSVDNTRQIVQGFIKKYPNRIKYIYQTNQGPAAARNTGIKNSTGEYIGFLDSDDLWLPDKIAQQLQFFKEHPNYYFVYSDAYMIDSNGAILKNIMQDKNPVSGKIFPYLLKENFIPILSVLIKKQCCDKAGYFCEDRAIISTEDHHFWLKVSFFYDGGYLNKVVAKYRVRDGSLSSFGDKISINDLLVLDKIAEQFPSAYQAHKAQFNRGRAIQYFNWAYHEFITNNFRKAQHILRNAIKADALYLKSYKLLITILCIPAFILRKKNKSR